MKRLHIIHAVIALVASFISTSAHACHALCEVAMMPFRLVSADTFRTVISLPSLVTFKLIGTLKPEYRESYRSHGLNFHLTA